MAGLHSLRNSQLIIQEPVIEVSASFVPRSSDYFIGVDGGGTRTRVALGDDRGQVFAIGVGGPTNTYDVGVLVARENLMEALANTWRQAGISPRPCGAAFLGIAGIMSPEDRTTVLGMAVQAGLADPGNIQVDHDMRVALAGGLAGEPGIAIIAGTGSSCYARNRKGDCCRVGGWGWLLDDVGSGYDLGHQALSAVVRSVDGRLPNTVLMDRLLPALNINSLDQISHRIYYQGMSRSGIAGLAPIVISAAEAGDGVALSICEKAASGLAELTCAAASSLAFGPGELKVVLSGGLINASSYYRRLAQESITQCLPEVEILPPIFPPVIGALILAYHSAGIEPSIELQSTLRKTLSVFGEIS